MAASISYKISGKADTKALEKTQSGIQKIGSSVKKLNAMVGGMVIAKVMQGINKVVNGSTESFMAQNKAATLANKAFQNNTQLTQKSIQNIKNAMNSFSLNNLIDGDTLNNAASLASQMGLNEEQIVKVMDAATEMSSAGIMTLDQAVKELSETYTGNLGELKKLNPELANLTDEQLKAGAAVDAMKTKYNGFRTSLSETFDGRNAQIKNQFSDLQSSIGGVIQALKFEGQSFLLPKLQEITSFIEEHRNQIINFFLNLPDIALTSLKSIKNIVIKFYETLPDFCEFMFGSLTNWIEVVESVFVSIRNTYRGYLTLTFGNLATLFYNKVIIPIKTWVQESINDLVEKHPIISKGLKLEKVEFDLKEKDYFTPKDYAKGISNSVKVAVEQAKKASSVQSKLNDDYLSDYKDIGEKLTSDLQEILNRDLPDDLKKALSQGISNIISTPQETTTSTDESDSSSKSVIEETDKVKSAIKEISSSSGELGNVITNILAGNFIGIAVEFASSLFSSLSSVSENFSRLLSCLSTISGVIAEVISNTVNLDVILQPFVDILADVGIILGTVLSVGLQLFQVFSPTLSAFTQIINLIADIVANLTPLISIVIQIMQIFVPIFPLLKMFASLMQMVFNVVAMVINALAPVISGFANFFITMWNSIVDIFNYITIPTGFYWDWGPHFSWTSLADLMGIKKSAYTTALDFQVDTSSNASNYETTSSNESVSSGSASYTAAKDIYVNIYFNNSFVNGDAQEIAIMLKKEIARAESKNLV